MAIDEIEGETCDITNTILLSTITVAPDNDKLNEKSVRSSTANSTVSNLNYSDDDVIFLESDNLSDICLIIDDDNEQHQEINSGNSQNNSLVNDKHPIEIRILEDRCLHETHEIIREDLDDFCAFSKVLPPLRQYGRKHKKKETTLITNISSSSSKVHHSETVCERNINKSSSLPDHHIPKEQENDGLKTLAEISHLNFSSMSLIPTSELEEAEITFVKDKLKETSRTKVDSSSPKETTNVTIQNTQKTGQQNQPTAEDGCDQGDQNDNDGLKTLSEISDCIFSCTSSITESGSAKSDNIPVQHKSCSTATNLSQLNSTNTLENKNRQQEPRQQIQQDKEKACEEKEKQLEQEIEKDEDIKFHLNKIFESNELNNKEKKHSPVVVRMENTPIIISEDGVVTVIYKPEKVKLRRNIENFKTISTRRSFSTEERTESNTAKEQDKCSSSGKSESHSCRDQPIGNGLTKTDKADPRVGIVEKQKISGIRWLKRKYSPIRKVKYEGEMVYKCTDCDFVHPNCVAALRRHMVRHQSADSIEWFYCDLCNYKAKRKGNLKVHMILHRNPEELVWYKCETCNKKFKHKNGLYSHEKRHVQREELEQYLCGQCPYKTPFKHTLLRHKINHEPTEKKKLLLCSLCSYSTYNKYYLTRHRQTHSEPIYKCLLCKYEAKYKVNLESHMKRHFPEKEMFYCDSCDYSTNRRYTLTLHNRRAHNFYSRQEDQLVFCYNCSFQTRFKRCLVKHMSMHCGIPGGKEILTRIKTEITTD